MDGVSTGLNLHTLFCNRKFDIHITYITTDKENSDLIIEIA